MNSDHSPNRRQLIADPMIGPWSFGRTLIIAGGDRAEKILSELMGSAVSAFQPVGIIDADGFETKSSVADVRVVGRVEELPRISRALQADFAIIALDRVDVPQMRRVVDHCIAAGLRFKTIPPEQGELEGAVLVNLRDVRLEDVLGGHPINLDLTPVSADLHNRVVLLTGAAGSIGSELARQIAPFSPSRLVLLDRAESELYFLQLELKGAHPDLDVVPIVGDITNSTRLTQIFGVHRPEYVVHAAAYKHVPLMEENVGEAARNNVLGTLLVASTAVKHGARKVLLLSSDKAIRPSSVMGATKRIAERIIFELPDLHRSGTDFRAVRFGNVMASRGSVIPLFERQLAAGGPLTVTHPAAERYFMTIPTAAQLVLQAGSLPEAAGAIAMLDMGEPVGILNLAEKMIYFSGMVPGKDVRISFTGLRKGEKLTEDQISDFEAAVPTSSPTIRISQTLQSDGSELIEQLSQLFACLDGHTNRLRHALRSLVPECVPPLADASSDPVPGREHPSDHESSAWRVVLNSAQRSRERRRQSYQFTPVTDELKLDERRHGTECRRKEARAGGRRSTDAGVALPIGSPAGP